MRLDDAMKAVQKRNFGNTDCSQPMLWALLSKTPVDTFVIYADNETWAGMIQPDQALRQYRERMGTDAKLIVVGMTATEFSIANPNDTGMLDIIGLDIATPGIIAEFSLGL